MITLLNLKLVVAFESVDKILNNSSMTIDIIQISESTILF